jgi:phosphatidate cytidylyltransferase
MGHLYICGLVAVCEMLLFRELVRVRYSAYYRNTVLRNTIPLFRTTQWLWFAVAIFYTYGDFVSDIIQNNQELHYLLSQKAQYLSTMSFTLYSGTFVLTIATLQREHIKFQINQLCWTILVRTSTTNSTHYSCARTLTTATICFPGDPTHSWATEIYHAQHIQWTHLVCLALLSGLCQ